MKHSELLIVQAIIPSIENPDVHIVEKDSGGIPVELGIITQRQEDLLHSIGRRVLRDHYLTLNKQLSRGNIMQDDREVNISHILANPISKTQIELTDNYIWSDELAIESIAADNA